MNQNTQQAACPHCSAKINFAKFRAKHNIRCPACRNWLTLPDWAETLKIAPGKNCFVSAESSEVDQTSRQLIPPIDSLQKGLPPLPYPRTRKSYPIAPQVVAFGLITAVCFSLPFLIGRVGLIDPVDLGVAKKAAESLLISVGVAGTLAACLIPWLIAFFRRHPQHVPILIFSVAFGWLFPTYVYANLDNFMILVHIMNRHGKGDLMANAASQRLSMSLVFGLPLIFPWVACLAWSCWPLKKPDNAQVM